MKELVLLVEDDPDDLELTLTAFQTKGFGAEVEVARDGAAVLKRLRGPGRVPDLLVLDLNIPKLSGLEVLERLRLDALLAALPVVILSSSDDAREKRRATELGALAFLRKPLMFEEFQNVIDALEGILKRRRNGAPVK